MVSDQLGIKMRWERARYYIEDGLIKKIPGSNMEGYDPFDFYYRDAGNRSEADIPYLEFISLNEDDESEIEAFVNKYGLLGIERRRLLNRLLDDHIFGKDSIADHQHIKAEGVSKAREFLAKEWSLGDGDSLTSKLAWARANPALDTLSKELGQTFEPLARLEALQLWPSMEKMTDFAAEVKKMRTLASHWEALKKGADENAGRIARDELVAAFRKELRNVQPTVGFEHFEELKPVLSYRADDLLSAMYAMFALDVTRGVAVLSCKNEPCRRRFTPEDPRQIYCTTWCQTAQKQREYRRRKKKKEEITSAE